MKIFTKIVLCFLLICCGKTLSAQGDLGIAKDKPFRPISAFPAIPDSNLFVQELLKTYSLNEEGWLQDGKITHYQKIKLNGSNNDFILLEYDYRDGPMSAYPWKYQFIFTTQGKLIETLDAKRFELLSVFSEQNPFLLAVFVTGKGNGGHELYKISADTLENVYNGMSDYFPRTYDEHQDMHINEPYELRLAVRDMNRDGLNDLVFSGNIIFNRSGSISEDMEENTRIPVEYIFLYNPKTSHFEEKEDYSKKYLFLDEGIPFRPMPKLFVVGDFDGDGKQDTISQHVFSSLSQTEIEYSPDPFAMEDWDRLTAWFYEQEADVCLVHSKLHGDTLHLGVGKGLYCLINVGDNNADGKDEVAFVVDYCDYSAVNSCKIYSLCKNKWTMVKRIGIHEGTFGFEVLEDAPTFSEIESFLEKKNGKWFYRDYDEYMENNIYEDLIDFPMKPLKTDKCK